MMPMEHTLISLQNSGFASFLRRKENEIGARIRICAWLGPQGICAKVSNSEPMLSVTISEGTIHCNFPDYQCLGSEQTPHHLLVMNCCWHRQQRDHSRPRSSHILDSFSPEKLCKSGFFWKAFLIIPKHTLNWSPLPRARNVKMKSLMQPFTPIRAAIWCRRFELEN